MKKNICFLSIIFFTTLFSMENGEQRNLEEEVKKICNIAKQQTSRKPFFMDTVYLGFIDFIRRQLPQLPFSAKPEDLRSIISSESYQAEKSNF